MHLYIDMMRSCIVTSLDSLDVNVAWISGMPRSGTTWISQVFAASPNVRLKSCPLFSYEFKNQLDESSTPQQWNDLYCELYKTSSDFLDQEHLRKRGLVPTFEKDATPKNLLIKSNRFHNLSRSILVSGKVKLVYVVRNPCAAIYSWLNDPDEFPENCDPLQEWKTGACRKTGVGEFWGFDDWVKVTKNALSLCELFPTTCRIVRYEDVVRNPIREVKALCDFCEIDFVSHMQDFLDLSHSRHDGHKHSVFKDPNQSNKWQEKLDSTIISTCKAELCGTPLEVFLS